MDLRHRFATSMVDCRAAAAAYPGGFPAQLGSLYRRVVGRLPDEAARLIGEPWQREFLTLTPIEQARTLRVARQPTD
ncbi:hypothetical protein [Solirubrobacter soli]|uniref:hypothetical protein n=1 Tax=Solirubrobacter soli TaxID=363832 RepID=UPI000429277B|nr:hypothetical protein [Solirubrobacter soli]